MLRRCPDSCIEIGNRLLIISTVTTIHLKVILKILLTVLLKMSSVFLKKHVNMPRKETLDPYRMKKVEAVQSHRTKHLLS